MPASFITFVSFTVSVCVCATDVWCRSCFQVTIDLVAYWRLTFTDCNPTHFCCQFWLHSLYSWWFWWFYQLFQWILRIKWSIWSGWARVRKEKTTVCFVTPYWQSSTSSMRHVRLLLWLSVHGFACWSTREAILFSRSFHLLLDPVYRVSPASHTKRCFYHFSTVLGKHLSVKTGTCRSGGGSDSGDTTLFAHSTFLALACLERKARS